MKKRAFSILLAFVLVLGMFPATAFATEPAQEGHWADQAVNTLNGIYGSGFAAEDTALTKGDVYIYLNSMGIAKAGFTEGSTDTVTRGDACAVLADVYDLPVGPQTAIEYLYSRNIVNDSTANGTVTKAQFAVLMFRILNSVGGGMGSSITALKPGTKEYFSWMYLAARKCVSFNAASVSGNIDSNTWSSWIAQLTRNDIPTEAKPSDGFNPACPDTSTTKLNAAVQMVDAYIEAGGSPTIFSDVQPSQGWYEGVMYLFDRQYITGTGSGTFAPEAATSRYELAVLLERIEASNASVVGIELTLPDNLGNDSPLANDAVLTMMKKAVANGYMTPQNDKNWWTEPASREEAVVALLKQADVSVGDVNLDILDRFTDVTSIKSAAKPYLAYAVSHGLVSGTGVTSLSPTGTVNRGGVGVLAYRILAGLDTTKMKDYEENVSNAPAQQMLLLRRVAPATSNKVLTLNEDWRLTSDLDLELEENETLTIVSNDFHIYELGGKLLNSGSGTVTFEEGTILYPSAGDEDAAAVDIEGIWDAEESTALMAKRQIPLSDTHTAHYSCGVKDCNADHNGDANGTGHSEVAEWTEWNGSDMDGETEGVQLTAGSYYLTGDVGVDSTVNVVGEVNLCLNGKTISAAGGYFNIGSGSTLNLCSCSGGGTVQKVTGGESKPLIYARSGAAANLYNVTLDGGAVWGGTGDSVLLRGTTISGITSSETLIDAGAQRLTGGHITLNSGVVLQNNSCSSSGDGGAVTLGEDGTLVINGATIRNNTNTSGNAGAIKAYAGAQITLNSGEIYGNSAYKHGGAIQIFGGDSTDYADTVLIMNGGTIHNNEADGVGGAVAVSDYSSFTMNGGSITANATTDSQKRGGGVGFGDANTNMTVSGSAVISGNTVNSTANNLYIGTNACNKVTVRTMEDGADIRITMKGSPGVFSTGGKAYKSYFKPDDDVAFEVQEDEENLKLVEVSAGDDHSHCVCGAEHANIGDHTAADSKTFIAWNGTDPITYTEGVANVYLNNDVNLSGSFTVAESNTLNLCLNGNTLRTKADEKIIVNGTLNITDCQTTAGSIVGNSASNNVAPILYIPSGGTANLYKGTLSGNTYKDSAGGAVAIKGAFNLYDGTITGNIAGKGGGVAVNGGTFNMFGGSITGNTTTGYEGGGVYLPSGTFNMSGGSITGNTVPDYYGEGYRGGGVHMSGGIFNVSGNAQITGNKGKEVTTASNVFLVQNKTLTVTGALTNENAVGISTQSTPTENVPVAITGNNGANYSACFFSDDPAYRVVNDEESGNVLKLEVKTLRTPTAADFTFTPPGTLTYDGTSKAATVTGAAGMGAITVEYYKGSEKLNSAPTDAGEYTVKINAAAGSEYAAASGIEVGSFTIAKANITTGTVDGIASQVYIGSAIEPVPVVKHNGESLEKDKDYTVAYSSNVNAGTATVTITGKGNYTGEITANFSINKADATDAMKTASGTLVKGGTTTVTLPALPTGAVYGEPSESVDATESVTRTDGVLTVAGNGNVVKDTTYTVTVPVTGAANYNDYTITVTLTGTDKLSQAITVEDVTATYGDSGMNVTASTTGNGALSYAVTAGADVIDIDDGGNITVKKAGAATVTVTAAETAEYAAATKTVTVTVNKKTVTVTAKNQSIYVGQAAPDLSSPVEGTHYTVTGLVGADTIDLSGITVAYGEVPDTSAAGTFAITVTGAAGGVNYAVEYVNGTLTISSAPAPSNPGPSSSSGSSFGTTITVPVSGEENTVHVDAKVTGQSAKVEPVDAKEVEHISEGQTEMPVTMDFSGLKKTITEVKIPTQSVELIAEAANDKENKVSGLKVELSKAGVEFDAKALETVAAAAKNADDITLIVDERAANKLTDAQQKTIKDMPNKLILEATLLINGTPVHDFKGGSVTVTFDYELAANQKAEHITVWHVADDGTKEAMQTRYDAKEKVVRFVAPHFSHYVVTGDEANYQHVCPSESYTDVDQSLWYHESVDYVIETGLMFGYGNGIFKPNGTVTRQQVWMTLARLNGAAPVNMVEARTWAMEHGVSDGTNPTAYITRQQFIAMLWRYAKDMGYDVSVGEDTNILSYTDAFDIAEYAVPAMQWGCGAGVMGGYTDGSLKPTATTTRAHMAAFLQRFCEKAVK